MKLSDGNSKPLTRSQNRVLLAVVCVLGLVLLVSGYSHIAYRQLRAYVVGNTIDLASRSDGRVAEILLKENEPYRRGTLLVRLSNPGLESEVALLENEISEIQSSLTLERSGQGLARRRYDLETAEADARSKLASARYGMEAIDHVIDGLRARRDVTAARQARAESLVTAEAMTVAELENRQLEALEAAREYEDEVSRRRGLVAEVAKQQRLLELIQARLENQETDRTDVITDLEIKLADRETELGALLDLVGELTIVAEHDGVVTDVLRREGEYVPAGESILTVMRADDVWVEAYLPVAEKRSVQPGDPVDVRSSQHGGRTLRGRVDRILPVLQPLPGSAVLGNDHNYAVVVIVFDESENARDLLSPAQLVAARVKRRWGLFPAVDATAHDYRSTPSGSAGGDRP